VVHLPPFQSYVASQKLEGPILFKLLVHDISGYMSSILLRIKMFNLKRREVNIANFQPEVERSHKQIPGNETLKKERGFLFRRRKVDFLILHTLFIETCTGIKTI